MAIRVADVLGGEVINEENNDDSVTTTTENVPTLRLIRLPFEIVHLTPQQQQQEQPRRQRRFLTVDLEKRVLNLERRVQDLHTATCVTFISALFLLGVSVLLSIAFTATDRA